jgi:hypothetical protein
MTSSSRALEFDVLGESWFVMGATLSKISICFFFFRVLGSARHWKYALGAVICVMAVVDFIFALMIDLQCRPLHKLWNPSIEGECWDPSVLLGFGYFQGSKSKVNSLRREITFADSSV